MKLSRVLLGLAVLACFGPLRSRAEEKISYRLIAHRGGVVEDKFPDNSAPALAAAVARGYWGVEVDIRETKDGVLVMRHDPDLKAYYGDPRQLADLTYAELEALKPKVPGHRTWRFEELVKAAHDAGLRVMLDSKDPHRPGFVEKVEATLRQYDMLGRCYIIGTRDALDHFAGKAPVGWKYGSLKARIEADPASASKYFLFDEGISLTPEAITWARAHHLEIIPSINVYHYYDPKTMAGKSRAELAPIILAAAHRDIEKFQALGVVEFQIDSEFDRWLQPH